MHKLLANDVPVSENENICPETLNWFYKNVGS